MSVMSSLRSLGVVGFRRLHTSSWLSRRPNLSRPLHPSVERRRLLSLSEPSYPEPHVDTQKLWQECPRHSEITSKVLSEVTANEFEALFVQELKEWMSVSKMVGICHVNSMRSLVRREVWQNARRLNLELKQYESVMALNALSNTKYQPLLHFWQTAPVGRTPKGNVGLLFAKEINPKALIQYDKKNADVILLGALLEDRVVTKDTLRELSELPSIDVLRSNLVALLDAKARESLSILGRNQSLLSAHLETYVKENQ